MAEDRDALLQHYKQMGDELLSAIDGLTDEQLTDTSLDGWAVKDHLAHVALWDDVRAQEIARISAGHESAWRMSGNQDDAFNDLTYNLRLSLSPAQAKWELAASRKKLLEAIAAATARGLDPSLYGEAGLHSSHQGEHAGWIKRWREERGR